MRSVDFAPLSRSTIGFDRMLQLFEDATRLGEGENSYPPYNIEKLSDDSYRITMAVAGFAESDLSITQQANSLLVAGRKQGEDSAQYLHHGLATRAFERRFDLADFIKVTGASLVNGLLAIDLVREVPEAMKPRSVKIESRPPAGFKQVGGDGKGKAV
ncbi:MAG TPA: Hsp20 family protein [Stellaceae bacterium]|jgi:molecular chaperone IbpA|nr:Hsp20 family protein [Stellaceae bacterium]